MGRSRTDTEKKTSNKFTVNRGFYSPSSYIPSSIDPRTGEAFRILADNEEDKGHSKPQPQQLR